MGLVGEMASDAPSYPTFFDQWMPPWTAASVRARGGAFVVESSRRTSRAPARRGTLGRSSRRCSPTTVVLAEGHDVGEQVNGSRSSPPTRVGRGIKQVEDTLA